MPEYSPSDFARWLRHRRAARRARLFGGSVGYNHPDFYDEYGDPIEYDDRRYFGCLIALILIIVVVFGLLFWVCDPFGGDDNLITTPTFDATTSTTGGGTTSTLGSTTTTTLDPLAEVPEPVRSAIQPLDADPATMRLRIFTDLIGRLIDSISENEPGYEGLELDIVDAFIMWAGISGQAADNAFNDSVYECGATDPLVVCAAEVQDMPEGEILVVAVRHAEPVPTASTERSYIYSLVFESDGDPANDWVFNPPFDWDFFRGADRWYEAVYDHTSGTWSLRVTQVSPGNALSSPLPSAVRVVVVDEWVIWFVPSSEIPDFPGRLRAVAFGHDGNFTQSTRGGDVTGADPTESPFDPEAEPEG